MAAPPPTNVLPWSGLRVEITRLASLGWPVSLGSLGMVTMYAVDTAMVGHLGKAELSAVALGNLWLGAVAIVGRSVIHGLDPLVAQAFGAQDREAAGDALVRGLQVALLVSIPVLLVLQLAAPGLRLLGQPEALLPDAQTYIRTVSFGIAPMMVFWAMRQWLQGLGLMKPATWVALVANLINVALNVVCIYGVGGVGGWGIWGAGWATTGSQVFLALGLAWLVRHELAAWWPTTPRWGDVRALATVLGLGVPIALQVGLEMWAFNGAAIMMGWLGSTEIAAHAVALNLASVAFMVPLGFSAAAATRVGNLIGAGHRWQPSGWVAIAMGCAVMFVSGVLFLAFPRLLARIYSTDAEVIALAAALLPFAAVFGFFDGLQVTAFGVLRGAGDVRVPSLVNVVGYWVIGLPVGWWLASRQGMGPYGIWAGLVLSLGIVATLLLWRVAVTGRRGGVRVGAHQGSAS